MSPPPTARRKSPLGSGHRGLPKNTTSPRIRSSIPASSTNLDMYDMLTIKQKYDDINAMLITYKTLLSAYKQKVGKDDYDTLKDDYDTLKDKYDEILKKIREFAPYDNSYTDMTDPDNMKSDDEARQERAKRDPVNFQYIKKDYPILEQFEMPEKPEKPEKPSLLKRICCSCRKNKFKSKSKKSKSKKSKSKSKKSKNNIGR
jgi:hypothetical protein